tara:strand:- start:3969 stop:4421 length:453 start_codon:yes stop_codon:yes gene_type:complete
MGVQSKQSRSLQSKAGVDLSVSRSGRLMRRGHAADRVSSKAPVYVTGAVQHMVEVLLHNARMEAKGKKAKRISSADIIAAVRKHPDLARLFCNFAFGSSQEARKSIEYTLQASAKRTRDENIKAAKADREKKKMEAAATPAPISNSVVAD